MVLGEKHGTNYLPYTLSCVAFFVKEHTGLLRIDTKRKRG